MRLWGKLAGAALALVGEVLTLGQVPPTQGPRRSRPTLFLVGDSTANHANQRGWGAPFADYFDVAKITVINRACALQRTDVLR